MTQSPRSHLQTTIALTSHQALMMVVMTALDTTWRAFVPTVGGTVIGILLDKLTGLAPLFTTVLIILGFVLSAALIALQIKKVRRSLA